MEVSLHKNQSQVIRDLFVTKDCRYAVVNAARGFGKSYLAATAAMLAAQELINLDPSVPNKNIALIAPTYSQAVDIYYPLLAWQLGLEDFCDKSSKSAGTFWFPNNVTLKLWSYEASARLRGTGQYFVIADEVTSWHGAGMNLKESWESIIQPCVTTRWSRDAASRLDSNPGRALIISTPKGYDYFYDLYNRQDSDKDWKSYHYTYEDSPFLDPKEIAAVKLTLDPLKFAREYRASFEDSGNNVFYTFNRKEHIDPDMPYFDSDEDVHIAIDFNVGIMAATAFALRGNQIHILDEFQGAADTETLAQSILGSITRDELLAIPIPQVGQEKHLRR